MEDKREHQRAVLQTLRDEKFFAKKSKCSFAQPQIDFCGFLVDANGISTQPQKVAAMRDWPQPQSAKDVRSYLGLCGFYQKFIRNC